MPLVLRSIMSLILPIKGWYRHTFAAQSSERNGLSPFACFQSAAGAAGLVAFGTGLAGSPSSGCSGSVRSID